MKTEIDRHKWIESEKAGYDIGIELALMDWILRYRVGWRRYYMETYHPSSSFQKSSLPNKEG
jgi:hypothetical protein